MCVLDIVWVYVSASEWTMDTIWAVKWLHGLKLGFNHIMRYDKIRYMFKM